MPYADLGVATSGVSFLRTLGSCFGVAVFGTIYSNSLSDKVSQASGQLPAGVDPQLLSTPAGVHALPEPFKTAVVDAYTSALQTVFRWAVPVAILAVLIALLLNGCHAFRPPPVADLHNAICSIVAYLRQPLDRLESIKMTHAHVRRARNIAATRTASPTPMLVTPTARVTRGCLA